MAACRKTGGRQAGTPNRRSLDVVERLAALGCDPIEGMARIAMDSTAPVEVRARMFAELARYVAPKRRAVEHSAEGAGEITISWSTSAVDNPRSRAESAPGFPAR
jgi:hypothetical protein